MPNVIPFTNNALLVVWIRFIVVAIMSILSLFLVKCLVKDGNSRKFIGV